MKRHCLPGEGENSAWFHRLNGFEQQETLRQVAFKRKHSKRRQSQPMI